jgi:hypothetical protein
MADPTRPHSLRNRKKPLVNRALRSFLDHCAAHVTGALRIRRPAQ